LQGGFDPVSWVANKRIRKFGGEGGGGENDLCVKQKKRVSLIRGGRGVGKKGGRKRQKFSFGARWVQNFRRAVHRFSCGGKGKVGGTEITKIPQDPVQQVVLTKAISRKKTDEKKPKKEKKGLLIYCGWGGRRRENQTSQTKSNAGPKKNDQKGNRRRGGRQKKVNTGVLREQQKKKNRRLKKNKQQ